MVTTSTPIEQRVLLKNISWQLFESLLLEMGEQRSTRLAYHKGNLELMTPLWEHENRNRLIERLISTLVEELNLEFNPGGSVTLKRSDMSVGKEPDSCYYIQNEARVRGKTEIDLTQDPPPDLAIEIDITNSSLNQLALYADLGVFEIWRFDGRRLKIYQLQNEEYTECDYSPTFPLLPATKVEEFIEQCQTTGVITSVRQLREWVRNQQPNSESRQS
ncbi:MAG: Uma2 family endonuclease [Gloeocapsa sp. UFS-A4-WI-NPMV-4B04]|jgi:Uma2 family endonuclease|nr:Uma2 family endonuclease [Gloeocapsa sp. UFS-A4-WI-NPMV-4B04]